MKTISRFIRNPMRRLPIDARHLVSIAVVAVFVLMALGSAAAPH